MVADNIVPTRFFTFQVKSWLNGVESVLRFWEKETEDGIQGLPYLTFTSEDIAALRENMDFSSFDGIVSFMHDYLQLVYPNRENLAQHPGMLAAKSLNWPLNAMDWFGPFQFLAALSRGFYDASGVRAEAAVEDIADAAENEDA